MTYHNSPSKNISSGMESMTCLGTGNRLPFREYKAFFSGFQNPRTPSYFSNIHLLEYTRVTTTQRLHNLIYKYQFTGSTSTSFRKQAVIGCPIPSTFTIPDAKKSGGASRGIGLPSKSPRSESSSGRASLIVAARLRIFKSHNQI